MNTYEKFLMQNKHEIPENSVLVIVCNSKSKTQFKDDYDNFSINTEFLSDDELAQIIKMAEGTKLPYRIFYDEMEFIQTMINSNIDYSRLIVYNSAQNGTGAGRKSLIPSLCKYFSIRHTGSDAYRLSLCRDKFAIASILLKYGIPIPAFAIYFPDKSIKIDSGKKYIAKPIYESSSIGISKQNVFQGNNIPEKYLLNLYKTMRQPLIIQEFIAGYEIEIPILMGDIDAFAFKPVVLYRDDKNLMMGDEILDYNLIYKDNYKFSLLPEQFDISDIQHTAIEAAQLLNLKGLCRVDFRMKSDKEFFVTDISTNPHFIEHSSVNFAFKKAGLTDIDIFNTILLLS